jgi:hypothetical protein
MLTQAEIGLAEADERIAEADQNIRQIGSLIPQLALQGYPTTEVEEYLAQMQRALHHLHAQRRHIVAALDGDEPPPRVARPSVEDEGNWDWRDLYRRLSRS